MNTRKIATGLKLYNIAKKEFGEERATSMIEVLDNELLGKMMLMQLSGGIHAVLKFDYDKHVIQAEEYDNTPGLGSPKVDAIKIIRAVFGLGLRQSKEVIDNAQYGQHVFDDMSYEEWMILDDELRLIDSPWYLDEK